MSLVPLGLDDPLRSLIVAVLWPEVRLAAGQVLAGPLTRQDGGPGVVSIRPARRRPEKFTPFEYSISGSSTEVWIMATELPPPPMSIERKRKGKCRT